MAVTAANVDNLLPFSSLPQDLLVSIISFVIATPNDLYRCARVCRAFRDVSESQDLWRDLAVHKYGAGVADATVSSCYNDNWKDMLKDDNLKGAMPTLQLNKPCFYRHNRESYWFCCLVLCLKWDRLNHQVRIYLDARGETDLRHPGDKSSVQVIAKSLHDVRGPTVITSAQLGFTATTTGEWIAEGGGEGHCKGYLVVPDSNFKGRYPCVRFCYANRDHMRGDYESIDLTAGPSSDAKTWSTYTLRDASPFQEDTPEMELARWNPIVPEPVLRRARSRWFSGTRAPDLVRHPFLRNRAQAVAAQVDNRMGDLEHRMGGL